MADAAHHMQMRQIVAGLSEGVILIEPDQTIAYANDAAVMMHGVTDVDDLGATVSEYSANFTLHYRNHREIGPLQHPLDRSSPARCSAMWWSSWRPPGIRNTGGCTASAAW